MADILSADADSLGCSKLTQVVSQADQLAKKQRQDSAFANTFSGFSNLVAALRACLSPQQVRRVLKGRARGGDPRRDAVRHTRSTTCTFAPASLTCPPPLACLPWLAGVVLRHPGAGPGLGGVCYPLPEPLPNPSPSPSPSPSGGSASICAEANASRR